MTTEPPAAFHHLLRHARRHAGFTQEELAERAGISVRAVSNLERGINRAPRRETLEMLASALDLSPEDALQWERARKRLAARPTAARGPGPRLVPVHHPPPFIPLVGREREQQLLQDCLAAAMSANGQVVLIGGEAGIGKTTLVEDLARQATACGALTLTGHCYDLSTTPPYGPWAEILQTYPITSSFPKPPNELRERDSLTQIPSRDQLFHIVADFLHTVADATPLVLILEDLHWSDIESIELLRILARQCTQLRIMLIASYRDDELTRSHPLFATLPLLVREARAERLELQPFDAEAMRTFVRDQYPLSGDDMQALASYLLQHTEGNPLFAAELLRSFEREGMVQEREGRWNLGNLDAVVPPPLLVQMIERQLATLDPLTRGALEVAALIGQEILLDLWQKVAGLDDVGLSVVIEEALVARVIEQHGVMQLRIRHALIRDVLYHAIGFTHRRLLHRQVAEALMEAQPPEADRVAYHFQQAGDDRSLEWLIRAGDVAAVAGADFAATERYEAALRLLGDDETRRRERGWLLVALGQTGRDIIAQRALACTEDAWHIGQDIGDTALEAWALYFLGEMRVLTGRNGLSEMEQGLAAIRQLSLTELPALPSRFRRYCTNEHSNMMDCNLILMRSLFGCYREALAHAEEYLSRKPPCDKFEWGLRGHAESARAGALNALGDPEGSAIAYRCTQDAYQHANWSWHQAINATVELHYGTLAYRADQPAERQRQANDVERMWKEISGISTQLPARFGLLPVLIIEGAWSEARELALPFANSNIAFHHIALHALGVIARWQGDQDLAWDAVRTGLPAGPGTSPGEDWMLFTMELQRLAVDLALDSGDAGLAHAWLQSHDSWLDASERVQGRAESHILWTRYHALLGNPELANDRAGRALQHAANPRQPLALISAHRTYGERELANGQHAGAEHHLSCALDLADACMAPYERALCLLTLAEVCAATNKTDEAWRHLDEIRTICTPLDATPALQRARAIAARLSVRRGQPAHPAGLTPREVEVLRLVAEGMTDAEVAERLFLSPRTVNSHLTSIYNKLSVNSRMAAARFAIEQGLTDPPTR